MDVSRKTWDKSAAFASARALKSYRRSGRWAEWASQKGQERLQSKNDAKM